MWQGVKWGNMIILGGEWHEENELVMYLSDRGLFRSERHVS